MIIKVPELRFKQGFGQGNSFWEKALGNFSTVFGQGSFKGLVYGLVFKGFSWVHDFSHI